ncbi:MAG: hypothetical protein HC880_04805 [Bacteroidia bacterium]|nr:hypothetical protein [Bacteroidia bacterium]
MSVFDKPSDNENTSANIPETQKYSENWLSDVARQSWEPELLISGIAIYLTLGIPNWLGVIFEYYDFHWKTSTEGIASQVSLLIYSGLLAGAYVLIVNFILHFAGRGVVGRHGGSAFSIPGWDSPG